MLTDLWHFFASIVAVVTSLADDAEHDVEAFDVEACAVVAGTTAITVEAIRAKTDAQAVRRVSAGQRRPPLDLHRIPGKAGMTKQPLPCVSMAESAPLATRH
ncbi:hypothetical protein KDK95_08045 [Actinospica sp. MGRD01-02]|uniref:Uncharacterized protein n=1 Tax=Actinospica acidithermotolerans TaxID=2828514 RepID=A0A941E977_9ACTN|nr:hypothetical protein [Actinospica acidithermotolerans]MBR7826248.1 hypothetical protein [Actinospica acidithermotolerans]